MDAQQKLRVVQPDAYRQDEQTKQVAEQSPRVPTTLSDKVTRAIAQRVDQEALGMIPSLSKEAAKRGLQATLDTFTASQADRVALEVLKDAITTILTARGIVQDAIAANPEVEADVSKMLSDLIRGSNEMPKVTRTMYYRRYNHDVILGEGNNDDH